MLNLTIGADPEFFVRNAEGTVVPAVNMVAGTKYDPLACMNGAMQVDGTALEFNIEPATTEDEFVRHIVSVRDNTLATAMQNSGMELSIEPKAYVVFPSEEFRSLPREATILGCEHDYNMHGTRNSVSEERAGSARTAGGHVHIGWSNGESIEEGTGHFIDCCMISTILYHTLEEPLNTLRYILDARDHSEEYARQRQLAERDRKNLYGATGAFRPKSYGIEYRGLSNAWMMDERLIRFVFRRVTMVMNMLMDGKFRGDDKTHLKLPHVLLAHSQYQALCWPTPTFDSYNQVVMANLGDEAWKLGV